VGGDVVESGDVEVGKRMVDHWGVEEGTAKELSAYDQ
jgi:hypothetical protein